MKVTSIIFWLILSGLGLCSSTGTFGQQNSQCGTANDVRIDKDKPTIYITFERFGKALHTSKERLLQEDRRGNSITKGSDAWLRLHNNTCWPISLIQYGMYVPEQKPGEAPGERFKRMGVLDDGAETALFYAVMKDGNQIGYSGTDSYDHVKLLPGRSTLFSVVREALKEKESIRVTFIYDWEFQKGTERRSYTNNEPIHYLESSSYDLKTQSEN